MTIVLYDYFIYMLLRLLKIFLSCKKCDLGTLNPQYFMDSVVRIRNAGKQSELKLMKSDLYILKIELEPTGELFFVSFPEVDDKNA